MSQTAVLAQASEKITWASLRRVCLETGFSRSRAATLAVAGRIRVLNAIGSLPKYALEDAMAAAQDEAREIR